MLNKKPISAALTAVLASGLILGAANASAHEKGDFILRLGAATVAPNEDSDALDTNLLGTLPGSEAEVDSSTQLGITMTYMLTEKWGVGLLAATPFEHDIKADLGGGLGKYDAGSAKQLPPTVTLQYFPLDNSSAFQPYVGVGVNYTAFFSEDVDGELEGAIGGVLTTSTSGDLDLSSSWGLALEAGFDYAINEKWFFSAQVWYLDIDTEADFTFTGAHPTLRVKTDVDIDPWVYNFAIGYKF